MCEKLDQDRSKFCTFKKSDLENCQFCEILLQEKQNVLYNSCLLCEDGYEVGFGDYYENQFVCQYSCGEGNFLLNGECVNCLENCRFCEEQEYCQSCQIPFFLTIDKKSCVSECKGNEIQHTTKFECQEGPVENCIKYITNFCQTCDKNYFIMKKEQECVLECPNKYSQHLDQCYACINPFCLNCIGIGDECTICEDYTDLIEGICMLRCKDGEFQNLDYRCQNCDNKCLSCDLYFNNCLQCKQQYYYYPDLNVCEDSCIEGFYQKKDDLVCYVCSDICAACYDTYNKCTKCIGNYYLQGYQCVLDCKKGFFKLTQLDEDGNKIQICEQCQQYCEHCQYKSSNCLKCFDEGYYLSRQKNCKKCSKQCAQCDGEGIEKCTECNIGYQINQKTQLCELQEKTNDNQILIIILSTVGIILLLIGVFLVYFCFKKHKNQLILSQQLLKNNFLQELKLSGYNSLKDELTQDQILQLKKDNQKHALTYQQFQLQFQKLSHIGQGSYGVVDKYYDRLNKIQVAIKRFKNIKNIQYLDLGLKEAQNIQKINELSPLYTIKLLQYFLVKKECEQIINSVEYNIVNNSINNNNSKQNIEINQILKNKSNNSQILSQNSTSNEDQYIQELNNKNNKQHLSINEIQNDDTYSVQNGSYTLNLIKNDKNNIDMNDQQIEQSIESINQQLQNDLAIVFELAEYTLQDKLVKKRQYNKVFLDYEFFEIFFSLSSALYDFHNKLNLTHRDIKPQNILFANKKWKFGDFGLAKFLNESQTVTNNHTLAGTLNYQSPEQKNNYVNQFSQNPKTVLPLNPFKCDIFSLGITLYEILTLKKIDNLNQNQQYLQSCINRYLLPLQEIYNPKTIILVKCMLEWDSENRISINEIQEQLIQINNEQNNNNNQKN